MIFSAVLMVVAAATWVEGVPLPASYTRNDSTRISHDFDEAVFLLGTTPAPRRGKFIQSYLSRTPEDFHEPADTAWQAWLPMLTNHGWQLKGHEGDSWSLSKTEKGVESWLLVNLAEFQDAKLVWVQVAKEPRVLVLTPPATKAETVTESQEWPYLKMFAGSKLENTGVADEPFDVTVAADKEPHLVGRGYLYKFYTPPSNLSKLELDVALRAALTKAGWSVLDAGPEGEGSVKAHYVKNGRDIWAAIGRAADDSNTGLRVSVADVGTDDWSSALKRDCRLPLYGVTFEFDKATLKPDAAPVLEKAAAALKTNGTLWVEVQGHTDDVGDEAYNLTLSGKRAEAVRGWLAGHGIAATRLTSRGYGKSQPVVENSSDATRARNRRVELKCQTGR